LRLGFAPEAGVCAEIGSAQKTTAKMQMVTEVANLDFREIKIIRAK